RPYGLGGPTGAGAAPARPGCPGSRPPPTRAGEEEGGSHGAPIAVGGGPVAGACDALGGSESGYQARARRTPSRAEQPRGRVGSAIQQVHAELKGRYGSPRMTAELNARGYECTENTVAHLMKTHGIRAKAVRRFVRTTDSRHSLPVADNL